MSSGPALQVEASALVRSPATTAVNEKDLLRSLQTKHSTVFND